MSQQIGRNGIKRLILTACVLAVAGLLGCISPGGKGLDEAAEPAEPDRESVAVTDGARPVGTTDLRRALPRISTREASAQDPFGLVPAGWPDDVRLHPRCKVAYSGEFGTGGLIVLTLVSPDVATMLGVQDYHIESLSDWESLQVNEGSEGDGEDSEALTVIAERSGAFLRIMFEQADPSFLATLPDAEYWLENSHPNPLVIRLYYIPLPTGE